MIASPIRGVYWCRETGALRFVVPVDSVVTTQSGNTWTVNLIVQNPFDFKLG